MPTLLAKSLLATYLALFFPTTELHLACLCLFPFQLLDPPLLCFWLTILI